MVNSDPTIEMPEIVTGAVPVFVSISDCVTVWPAVTLPKLMLLLSDASVGVAGLSCSCTVADPPLALAAKVAVDVDVTAVMLAGNVALDAPFATVIDDGTETNELLLARDTTRLVGTTPSRLTVQLS